MTNELIPLHISGTEGYAEQADDLIGRWQKLSFKDRHGVVADLLPTKPSRLLDIGSGIGTDAAAFAAMGHQVVAVEPTEELRIPGISLYGSAGIEWLDDSLPELSKVVERYELFDLIMITAVWMHLNEPERDRAMPRIASLLGKSGMLIMSLRHGPTPYGRRMFDVSAEETIQLASRHGLSPVLNLRTKSLQEENIRNNVSWTRLAFRPADVKL
ncbi:class I SAM-dependent methyltransferase [Undibacterium sp.]|uniref:class I SAM-dependent methyltransferase n=1 Tax=Undibacterium sp. TaxID=1914977 RepID=UPI002B8F6F0A|nr:class I SAM-dependent methyltransferase [Undibacterium sp.]HTD03463.1 class I SAM-dependent methyltransferase [Undibacterium sp.]